MLPTAVLLAIVGVAGALCHGGVPPPTTTSVYPPPNPFVCPETAVGCSSTVYDECCVGLNGLLVYAQNWTAGLYQNPANRAFISNDVLRTLPPNEFTVHGLWPDNCDGSYNTTNLGCDPSRVYENVTEIMDKYAPEDLLADLYTYWQGADGSYEWFWSHEWTKHATCFSPLQPKCFGKHYTPYLDVVTFFKKALALRNRFNLFHIFSKHAITPSTTRSYTRDDFNNAITAEIGKATGGIQCVQNSTKADPYNAYFVSEVWVYLLSTPHLEFEPVEATFGPKANFQSCPNSTIPIWYVPNPLQ
ncbi:ribonuclease T2-like [Irineochytrium annulatum]|nr:ribonuclease T2-like [Irineochytrium annulatum]